MLDSVTKSHYYGTESHQIKFKQSNQSKQLKEKWETEIKIIYWQMLRFLSGIQPSMPIQITVIEEQIKTLLSRRTKILI